jgi:hypothetical protein
MKYIVRIKELCPLKFGEVYWKIMNVPEDQDSPKEGQIYKKEVCDESLTEGGAEICFPGCNGNLESRIVSVETYSKQRKKELKIKN